eukprot:g78582.t1
MAEEQPREADPAVVEVAMAEQQLPPDPAVVEVVEDFQAMNVNVPRELGGRRVGPKKGAKRGGRKAGTPNEIRRLNDYYSVLNKQEGTATVFQEAKEGRVFSPAWGYRSDPRVAELYIVAYTDGTYSLFRKWANIQPISNSHAKIVKTAYQAVFTAGVE